MDIRLLFNKSSKQKRSSKEDASAAKKLKVDDSSIIDCTLSDNEDSKKKGKKDVVKRSSSPAVSSTKTVPSDISAIKPNSSKKKATKKRAIVDSDSGDAFANEGIPTVEATEKKKPRAKKSKSAEPEIVIEKKEPTKSRVKKDTTSKEETKQKQKRVISGSYKPRWMAATKDPPKHGSKPIPRGKPDCLEGIVFVLTGLNESLTREEMSNLIQQYGGIERSAVSKKTTYLIAGFEMEDGRPITEGSKYKAAIEKGVEIINEDRLLKMIRDSDPEGSAQYAKEREEEERNEVAKMEERLKKEENETHHSCTLDSSLLTSKYAPQTLDDLIGNKQTIQNIKKWLEQWDEVHITKTIEITWNKQNPGARAILISGPPGIGKTTAAVLISRLMKYDVIELNASDKRNMSSVRDFLKDSVSACTLNGFRVGGQLLHKNSRKVIVMDEVDGMSSGDRGGIQELIKIIKTTQTPIICICNDRDSPKVKNLASNCYDLVFNRPSSTEFLNRLQVICKRENITIDKETLEMMIESTGGDFRQILNQIQLVSTLSSSSSIPGVLHSISKDPLMGITPYEAAKALFIESSSQPLKVRYDMFFSDYEMTPLLVEQNYLDSIKSNGMSIEVIAQMAEAADAMCDMEMFHETILKSNNWSLLPSMAMITIRGGMKAAGKYVFPRFPMMLGKYSTIRKNTRTVGELQTHINLSITGSRRAVVMDYFDMLNQYVLRPLTQEDVHGTIDRMDEYGLTKDDLVDVLNGTQLGGGKTRFEQIPGKTKGSFTRIYNGKNHASSNVFADGDTMVRQITKGRKGKEKMERKETLTATESLSIVDIGENESALLAYSFVCLTHMFSD